MMLGVVADVPLAPPALSARAAGTTSVGARVRGFELLKVNQTTTRVPRGGSRPLCQAIPFTATRVKLRWTGARRGQVLRLDVKAPAHATRTRSLRIDAAGAGTRTVELTPRGEGLTDEAFPQGRYVFTLRSGARRLDRTSFTLTGAVKAC